jgi:hypothetical protein
VTSRSLAIRVVIPTFAVAVTTSVIAVVINYATTWQHNVWAWLAVGILTLVGASLSVWQYRQQDGADAEPESGTLNELTIGSGAVADEVEQKKAQVNRGKIGRKAHIGVYRQEAGSPAPVEAAATKESPGAGEA